MEKDNWFDLVSDNLSEKYGDELLTHNVKNKEKKNNISESVSIDFDKIKKQPFEKIDDLKLLENQMIIISILRKYFKNCFDKNEQINYVECCEKLKWILNVAQYFSTKMKMTILKFVPNTKVHRSSYKFCTRGCDCNFYYKEKKKCFLQHFVHNIVVYDIKSLLSYIENKKYEEIDHLDVQKTINTISFVIKHMHTELNNLVYYGFDLSVLYNK
jgi:hypothetical protein